MLQGQEDSFYGPSPHSADLYLGWPLTNTEPIMITPLAIYWVVKVAYVCKSKVSKMAEVLTLERPQRWSHIPNLNCKKVSLVPHIPVRLDQRNVDKTRSKQAHYSKTLGWHVAGPSWPNAYANQCPQPNFLRRRVQRLVTSSTQPLSYRRFVSSIWPEEL